MFRTGSSEEASIASGSTTTRLLGTFQVIKQRGIMHVSMTMFIWNSVYRYLDRKIMFIFLPVSDHHGYFFCKNLRILGDQPPSQCLSIATGFLRMSSGCSSETLSIPGTAGQSYGAAPQIRFIFLKHLKFLLNYIITQLYSVHFQSYIRKISWGTLY